MTSPGLQEAGDVLELEHVWECPDDGTVNAVGALCAGCGSSREFALLAARCRDGV